MLLLRRSLLQTRPRRPHCPIRTSKIIQPTSVLLTRPSTTSPSTSIPAPPPPPAAPYAPPQSGILSLLPPNAIPYAELTRVDKPTGTIYLLLPCLWSTLLAASISLAPVSSVLYTCGLFTAGAVVMRGAGCTINDLWDRNIDPHVSRTALRPLARRAVSPTSAVLFTGGQLLAGLAVLVQFPVQVIYSAIPSLAVVATYPAMKRVTNYPQVVLGMAFSWGAVLGFPALGLDLVLLPEVAATATLLYASNVAWTVLYDTVYAHQDIRDDKRIGVKSAAVAHERDTKRFLSALGMAQVGLLSAAGWMGGLGPVYYLWSCGGAALGTAWMVRTINLKDAEECWGWFKWCAWAVGGVAVGGGLAGEYVVRKINEEKVEEAET